MDIVPLPPTGHGPHENEVLRGEIVDQTSAGPPRGSSSSRKVWNCSGCCGPVLLAAVVLLILLARGVYELFDRMVGGVPGWFARLLAIVFIGPLVLVLLTLVRARLVAFRRR